MRRFRTPAFYVGRNASLVLRLRRAVVSGRRPEQQTRGQLWSGVQGRSPWGESPQAFDYTRKLVTCPGLRAAAQHRILWLRLRRAVISETKQVSTPCDGGGGVKPGETPPLRSSVPNQPKATNARPVSNEKTS